jgi:membrane-associated phospholipid phosphatase
MRISQNVFTKYTSLSSTTRRAGKPRRGNGNYKVIFLLVFFMFQLKVYGEDNGSVDSPVVPITGVLHNMGRNVLDSVTFNYGLNFIGAVATTYVFIETGWDWQWRTMPYHHEWVAVGGRPGLYIGYIIPAITPVITYLTGWSLKDTKLQIAGLALAQSVVLTMGMQSSLKMITGRALPGIVMDLDQTRDSRTNDFSGEFNWFNMNPIGGWPSSHTANAFAAAAAITEIYGDSLALKIAAYSYATIIGFGVTLNVHWASDAIAGALIGYAIGKTVGRSFNESFGKTGRKSAVSLYGSPRSLGVRIRW